MTRLVSSIVTAIFVLLAVAAVAPRLAVILNALVPVILVVSISAAVLRMVWWYTRRW